MVSWACRYVFDVPWWITSETTSYRLSLGNARYRDIFPGRSTFDPDNQRCLPNLVREERRRVWPRTLHAGDDRLERSPACRWNADGVTAPDLSRFQHGGQNGLTEAGVFSRRNPKSKCHRKPPQSLSGRRR